MHSLRQGMHILIPFTPHPTQSPPPPPPRPTLPLRLLRSRFVERLQNLRLSGAPPHGAPASPDAPRPSDEHVAQESHVMLQSMISSHAALVDTLRDLVVPHPSHWLSEVQSVRPGETDADTGGERPRGAAITMGIRPDVKQEDEEARESPKRGGHKLWGAPAAASEALKEQGLHGPEGGDKAAYGKDVDRTQGAALLPPQRPQHRGRLTVVLDLDGTLVSTYTVKRAPAVPRGLMRSYVVGKGGPLNADGVFVVERPGLREFLASLCQVAEVVLFTAGLEDYARPIVEAIDPDGVLFTACLYRPATIESKYYQCVKDMSRLGRPLARTVLVDDTPLAFLNQPHNGIPVFSFKGDPDDRLLSEAILPLIWNLSRQHDVRLALRRRFQMGRWFLSNGFDLPSLGISLDLPEAAAPGEDARRAAHALPVLSVCAVAHALPVLSGTRGVNEELVGTIDASSRRCANRGRSHPERSGRGHRVGGNNGDDGRREEGGRGPGRHDRAGRRRCQRDVCDGRGRAGVCCRCLC